MLKSSILSIFFLNAFTPTIQAAKLVVDQDNKNLLTCALDSQDGLLWTCRFKSGKIANRYNEEMDLSVNYKFHGCDFATDRINFGFKLGNQYFRAEPTNTQGGKLPLRGIGDLTTTVNSTDLSGPIPKTCHISVKDIDISPSSNTLTLWKSNAIAQAKILDLLIEQYKLAKSFSSFVNMSRASIMSLHDSFFGQDGLISSRLASVGLTWNDLLGLDGNLLPAEHMPVQWNEALSIYPEMIEVVIVGLVINSIKENRGIPTDPATGERFDLGKITGAAETIEHLFTNKIKEKILKEREIAEKIITNAQSWNVAMDSQLRDILDRVNQLL